MLCACPPAPAAAAAGRGGHGQGGDPISSLGHGGDRGGASGQGGDRSRGSGRGGDGRGGRGAAACSQAQAQRGRCSGAAEHAEPEAPAQGAQAHAWPQLHTLLRCAAPPHSWQLNRTRHVVDLRLWLARQRCPNVSVGPPFEPRLRVDQAHLLVAFRPVIGQQEQQMSWQRLSRDRLSWRRNSARWVCLIRAERWSSLTACTQH